MKTQTLVTFLLSLACILVISLTGCKKQDDFLNTKPNQSLTTPTSLTDLENLLRNEYIFNRACDPTLGEIASDDFYIQDGAFAGLTLSIERNAFIWAKTVYDASFDQIPDWNNPYQMVYYANTALDALPAIKTTDQARYNAVKGTALFYRSYAFFNLMQVFTMPYDDATAATQPGIPLRLTSNLNNRPARASQADCYNQIISDLNTALPLLPLKAAFKTQPSQPAVNALLARLYLSLGKYSLALNYSNACLAQYSTLNDYNSLNSPTVTGVNDGYLDEDIYHSTMVSYSVITVRRNTVVDSAIYNAYDQNDLRKTKFCTILDGLPQYPRFVGSYDFKDYKYSGLATDEIYLIKAECLARSGDSGGAMSTLNMLLKTRWVTGTFVPYTAVNVDDALKQILLERRKELLYRGLRWPDLRRLNKDPQFAVQLTKIVNGTTYLLPPNDMRYAFPIPDNEIQLGGLTQNPR
jgi:hypothetical protein